jgi:Zn-dependent protease
MEFLNSLDPVILFTIIILVFSIIIHEMAHGYSALFLGDSTAEKAGRLTLNPIPHIDFVGSIVIPAILILSSSPFLFGYAKPVPYNPENLRDKK